VELVECLEREWVSGHAHNPDRRLLHRWAGELGIAPQVTLETEDLHSMLAMIRAGLAVGLIPATLLGAGHDAGVERVVLESGVAPLHREILAVSRPGARSPAHRRAGRAPGRCRGQRAVGRGEHSPLIT
jgi:DNA-binding transcriptional LysR family regulator